MKLVLSKDYPVSPPKGFFLTKIFHPNVGPQGEICVNTLKKDWKPDLGIKVRRRLVVLSYLLIRIRINNADPIRPLFFTESCPKLRKIIIFCFQFLVRVLQIFRKTCFSLARIHFNLNSGSKFFSF